MGWLITLAILVLIAVLPIGISVSYDADGFRAFVKAGFARIQVFPLPKKEKKPKQKTKKETKPTQKQKKPAKKQPEKKKQGGSLTDFLPIVRLVLDLLDDFRRKLRVDVMEADLVLAGGDPCDLAINYGKTCGILGNLWPRLEEFLTIKKRDVKVQCDFEGDKTLITARVDLTITIGRIFSIGIFHGVKVIKEFITIMNKRKGGATT